MAEVEIKLENLKFEDALKSLEDLVARMEGGNVPLEDLIKDFEQGSKLVKFCRGKLDDMERKIEILTKDDSEDGEWKEFGDGETPRVNTSGELPF